MLLGLALSPAHHKSIIFRREYPQLKALIDRSKELIGTQARWNGQENTWRWGDGRILEFGAVQYTDDVRKYQGRPHDLVCFDELPNFDERQYLFLRGWARTTNPRVRVRTVSAGNPPTSTEGEWVIKRWAAWLDGQHPNPAQPGELRWYATLDGKDTEVESKEPFEHKGETITPQSRTFIPARLSDNPHLASTAYGAQLQNLPEPLRSQLLYGDFTVGVEDDMWQVIPTDWVRQAQARWESRGAYERGPLTAVGVDVARGGKDKTVLFRRYGEWFDTPDTYPGSATPNGATAAGLVATALMGEPGAYANVDVIGVGSSAYDSCAELGLNALPVNFAQATANLDRTCTMRFVNMRAYAYWSLREALDPEKGDGLALPPDNELLADLCSARWAMRVSGVQIESKDDIKARLGRSPDKGDACVLCALPNLAPRIY